jgi:hypothetical protein
VGDLILLYDNKFMQHPGKFRMHWLGPYMIKYVTKAGVVQLETLKGDSLGRTGEWKSAKTLYGRSTDYTLV